MYANTSPTTGATMGVQRRAVITTNAANSQKPINQAKARKRIFDWPAITLNKARPARIPKSASTPGAAAVSGRPSLGTAKHNKMMPRLQNSSASFFLAPRRA
ncbi:hypothetical protein D3C71_1803240 [compost metagenome]